MEEFLLKAKHFQVFRSLMIPGTLLALVPDFDPIIPLIKIIFITLPYIVWVFTLGKGLNKCVPARHKLDETFLTVNLFFFCIVFTSLVLFLDASLRFQGWTLLVPLYFMFSFAHLFYFASKALTSAEQGKKNLLGRSLRRNDTASRRLLRNMADPTPNQQSLG